MSHLSDSGLSKEDANRVYETPDRPDFKQNRKKNRIQCYRCGSSGHPEEIQNVLLDVRAVGNVKGKTISPASAKPNQRNEELITYKQS